MRIPKDYLRLSGFWLALLLVFPAVSRAVTLKTSDASGTTSFTGATNWSDGLAPHSGASYVVAVQYLRTPADANNYTFAGASLTLTNGGGMIYKGTATANTYTISPLILNNGGLVRSGSGSGNTLVLAGAISVVGTLTNSQILADQSPYTINSAISGAGSLLFAGSYAITANGTNSSTGNTSVSGKLTLGAGSQMNFKIGGAGTNNSVSGSGTAAFNGAFAFDLTGASTNLGDNWTVANPTTKTFGSTFSVSGFARLGGGNGAGTWQAATNGTYYAFTTANGVLQVVANLNTNVVVAATPPVFAAPIEADLLAAYAASYAASVGGEDNAQVTIANTVAGSNQIQDQGGTGAHLRVAGFYQSASDVTGQTTTGGIVTWLANDDSHLADVVAQGATVGADVVVYICNNSDSSSIAGVSQQPGFYSALNPAAVWSGVFAHETAGHAFGRSHSDGIISPKTIMLHNYCTGGAAPPYFYTNPKIWFNGVQLLGNTANNCSMGSLVNGGDNSSCSAQAVADRRARVSVAPDLSHVVLHWMFTNAPGLAPASTTNLDLVSGAPAIVRGNGAFYTGTTLRLPGGTTGNVDMNSMAAYIDLPNGIISAQTNLTIEIWATPLSAPNWARICDFGRAAQTGDGLGAAGEYTGDPSDPAPGTTTGQDDLLLSAAVGTDITKQRFEAELAGAATNVDANLATIAGVPHHYALTFSDGAGAYTTNGGRWQWFRDGDAIAYLDVSNHLAAIQDVNNWLGRSEWSADSLANNDYAEVRISNVALTRGQILANYLLGANYVPGATVTLTGSDTSGATSFNAAGQWSNGSAPAAANNYETFDLSLRTPATGSAYAFGGNALRISGGALLWQGTGSSTVTITNLMLNGGTVRNAGAGTCTLAGNLATTNTGGILNAFSGPVTLAANLSGAGPLTFLAGTTTLAGSNGAFTGRLFIGDGMAGTVAIDSPARLGASPTNFVANQLDLNRGTLQTTATLALNDPNRGLLLDISGGTFDVAPGTTLTLASPLASPPPPSGYSVVAGALTKADSGTLILSSPTNTFLGTLYVDSGSTSANDGVVKVVNNQVLAAAHSPIFISNNNSGSSTLQLDGTTGGITLPQQISLSGRSSAVAAIENVAGTNTISGGLNLNVGGGNYWIQSDAGWLNLGGTLTAAATGTRLISFQGNGNINVSGTIADGSATVGVAKSGGGTLALAGNNTFSGATTLSAGTLLVNGTLGTGGITAAGGTLAGVGTINGPVSLQAGATLAPSVGTISHLVINNSLTLATGSATLLNLSKIGGLTTNDSIGGLTSLACGGNLVVTSLGGTPLAVGDRFPIFAAGTISGAFASATLPALGPNLYWINRLTVDGTLAIGSTLPTNLVWSLAGSNLLLSWPSDHLGWRLLLQTNNLAGGFSPNTNDWGTVPNSPQTNLINLLIDPTLPLEFYRLAYP